MKFDYRVGCECDRTLKESERCCRTWIRCNGSLRAHHEHMKSRGLDNAGQPLNQTKAATPAGDGGE